MTASDGAGGTPPDAPLTVAEGNAAASPPWHKLRMLAFDLETTSADPEEARIVQFALAHVGGGLETETVSAIVNPGVDIPEGAAEIHGITTERAAAEGVAPGDAIDAIKSVIGVAIRAGMPLVAFNARYDLTVLARECTRHYRLEPTWANLLVVDPFVIDRWLDRYRRGSRRLAAVCEHYGATHDGEHDAAADAIAAARLAWVLGERGKVTLTRPTEEVIAQRTEWKRVRGDLRALQAAQRQWVEADRVRFAEYKRGKGETETADRILAERGWPVLEARAHA